MQSRTLTAFIPLFASAAWLLGCSGTDTPNKPSVVDNKTALSSLKLRDVGLQRCIYEAELTNGWKTVGDVTALRCGRVGKSRASGPTDDNNIQDTSEIKYFTALKQLDIAGNFYSKIDVSALTQLERLDVYEAFISELDLSKNSQLKSLNIGATGITQVDLRGLKNLEEIYLGYEATRYHDVYTERTYAEYGSRYVGLNNQQARLLQRDVRLDPNVKLKIIDTGTNGLLDLPDNKNLTSAYGQVNVRTITGAPQLSNLNVEIIGSGILDLSAATNLTFAEIQSNDAHDVRLGENLAVLKLSSIVTSFEVPEHSHLARLVLNDKKPTAAMLSQTYDTGILNLSSAANLEEVEVNSQDIKQLQVPANLKSLTLSTPFELLSIPANSQLTSMSLTNTAAKAVAIPLELPAPLVTLNLSNVLFDQDLDISSLTRLESLDIDNSVGLKKITLPNHYVQFALHASTAGIPIFYPEESVRRLTISNCIDGVAHLDPGLPNLEALKVDNCSAEQVTLADLPYLTDIELTHMPLRSIDVTPFIGRRLNRLYVEELGWNQAQKDDLRKAVKGIFKELYIF